MEDLKTIIKNIQNNINNKDENPVKRLESNSDKALQYSELLFRVRRQYNKIKIEYDKKYSELWQQTMSGQSHKICKNIRDRETFIHENNDYIELRKKTEELENIVKLLENIVEIYKQREASERMIFKFNAE